MVRAIREFLLANPDEVDDAEGIAAALGALERMLSTAHGENVRFRLSLDY